jgi:mevalonate kinase
MTTVSAPGKVYLFGEHAVVYGEPAIPCAIDRRARVSADVRDDDHVRVRAADLTLDGFTVEYTGSVGGHPDVAVPQELVDAAMGYIDAAVTAVREVVGDPALGFDLTVTSELPLGAGLGSSAAVVVATIDAASRACGTPLDRPTLAQLAYEAEARVQDGNASRADTYASTMGGAVRVEGERTQQLAAPQLPFVIGYDGGAGETGSLVAGVRSLREAHASAAQVIETIGAVVNEGQQLLTAASTGAVPSEELLTEVGALMDINHGLLSALGVSGQSLEAMVWAAREAGAVGAKLTGAGGAGCIVSLDPTPETTRALRYTPACTEVFRAELDTDGARVEQA